MAGTGVGKFSSTAGSNTANMTVNFAENMAPSNVNNAARELMGHMRDMYEQLGDGYFEFGDGDGVYTIARVDADTLTIATAADLSAVYFAGRKIRVIDGGANVVEGTITSTSHGSSLQTINLTGITLASGTPTKVEIGIDTAAFGGKIILDDDGDTFIEAPTDDTIDIHIAGAKDFVFTANTFTAESGSTIAAQALTATTVTASGEIDGGSLDISGDADIDGTTNLDVVDIDGALTQDGGAVFNEASADVDFRVESNGNANMLFVDGGNDAVNVGGTTSAGGKLNVETSDDSDSIVMVCTATNASEGPVLKFKRDNNSGDNGDATGSIKFQAENDANQQTVYFELQSATIDVADGSEDGRLVFQKMLGGSAVNVLDFLETETVFNEDSNDQDFRVESNGNANMIFVDGGNNHVNIGTATDLGGTLNVNGPIFYAESDTLLLRITSSGSDVKFQNRVADKDISFEGIDGSSAITALHLDMATAGTATFNDNIVIGTAGKGIHLGVTSATAANLLDDYEEGSYTPAMTVNSGSLTVHGSHNTLAYTKIGRVVHVQGEIRFSAISSPSGAFSMSIPFAVADLAEGSARFMSSPIGQSGFGGTPDGTLFAKNTNEGTTTIAIQTSVSGDGSDDNVNANQVSTSTEFIFSFTFIAA